MSLSRRAWIVFVTVLVITLAFDQGSKAWARGALEVHRPQAVLDGYWDWELAYNPGIAFSMLSGGTGLQVLLALIAAVALIGIGVVASRTTPEERIKRLGLALIAGGALGNLVDRIRDGAVTDFIRWRWHEHRWPIFNIADAALLVGVVFLVLDGFSGKSAKARYGHDMRLLWSLLLLAACKSEDDYPPISGGGGGGGFGTMPDAPLADTGGADGTLVTGRVCLVADLRPPLVCADTGAASINVKLGTKTATTADDGTFSLLATGGTNLVWRVDGTGLVSSTVPLSTTNILPIITVDFFNDLTGSNGVIVNTGQGSLVVYVTEGGLPLMGANVTVDPPATASYLPMHDVPNDPLTWVQGTTGPTGVSWTPGIGAGAVPITVEPAAGGPQMLTIPIDDGAITFATVVF